MLCLVCYLFVISISVIDCLGRFVPEMTNYASSGTLNLAKLKPQSLKHSDMGRCPRKYLGRLQYNQ